MNPYKWIYMHTPIKRPFTFFWRDIYHEAEWLIQLIWFSIGVTVGIFFGWKIALIIWGIYTLGYINGHLHWGKDWIKGQKGN